MFTKSSTVDSGQNAGVIVIERQVEELAGLEAGHGPLGRKIDGIDVIAVIGDFINLATEFLRIHWVVEPVGFVGSEGFASDENRGLTA